MVEMSLLSSKCAIFRELIINFQVHFILINMHLDYFGQFPHPYPLSHVENRVIHDLEESRLTIQDQFRIGQDTQLAESKELLQKKLNALSIEFDALDDKERVLKLGESEANQMGLTPHMRQIMEDNRERVARYQQRRKLEEEQIQEIEKMQRTELEQRERLKREAKKAAVEQGLKRIELRKEERRQQQEQQRRMMREKGRNGDALYVKMEKQYEKEIAKLELQRNKKLMQIRYHAKGEEDIREHELRYREILDNRNKLRLKERAEQQSRRYMPPQGSVIIRQRLISEEKARKEHSSKNLKERETNNKRKAEFLTKLKEQRPLLKVNSEKPYSESQQRTKSLSLLQIREAGLAYLKHSKRLADHTQLNNKASLTRTSPQHSKPEYIDYMKHYDRGTIMTHKLQEKLKGLDSVAESSKSRVQKAVLLRREAEQIKGMMDAKERMLEQRDDEKLKDQVTSLLLQSIRAKTNLIKIADI